MSASARLQVSRALPTTKRDMPEVSTGAAAVSQEEAGSEQIRRDYSPHPCHPCRMRGHHRYLVGGLVVLAAMTGGVVTMAGTADDLRICPAPNFHDGDALRCGHRGRSMRLYAIDAPEMPGACRPGRQCTPGDPFASRDHLVSLARGHTVTYRQVDTDRYGRPVVQAFAGGRDLSCQMVADGFAVEWYGRLEC